jgi:Flp pilus assembly secretin CpaC
MAENNRRVAPGQHDDCRIAEQSTYSSADKMPGAADILFWVHCSNRTDGNETELMINITPYLVKPVSEADCRTDGIHS